MEIEEIFDAVYKKYHKLRRERRGQVEPVLAIYMSPECWELCMTSSGMVEPLSDANANPPANEKSVRTPTQEFQCNNTIMGFKVWVANGHYVHSPYRRPHSPAFCSC